jgi:hypothetical protein
MATGAKAERRTNNAKTSDFLWLARLTHPLVFFGAALAIYEGTIGTALLTGKHSDATVIWLCVAMGTVILAAMGIVAILVFKKPQHLMLSQQDSIRKELRQNARMRAATKVLVQSPRPRTPQELIDLMDKIEKALSGEAP